MSDENQEEEQPRRVTPTYMPLEPTEEQLQVSNAMLEDEHTVSDDSGLNNKQKWERVMHVFKNRNATLFSKLDYFDVYSSDEPRTAEAASYVADLRVQFITRMLAEDGHSDYLHECWVLNRQWQVRLRERARLSAFTEAVRKVAKPN